MEIDFLGLHSKDSSSSLLKNQNSIVNPFVDSGSESAGGNISLSLCTTSPSQSQTELPYFNKRNTWRLCSSPQNEHHPCTALDHNHTSNTREIKNPALWTILCPPTPHHFSAIKVDRGAKVGGIPSFFNKARKCSTGYTPTVDTARRASLARFLQKRSHRLTQTRRAHLMGVSLNVCEAADIISNNRQ